MGNLNKMELGALWDIVRLLADGQYHSGESLGALLGLSRAAVWKHLRKLDSFGINLLSVKGRGYCIEGGLDLLDSEKIRSNLQSIPNLKLSIFPLLDSTNSFLARESNPAQQVCLAEFQTAGRGRRGRAWVSPLAQNIYCSIGWGFDGGVAALEGLSLAVGVAVARTLKKLGISDVALKWPNDVLYFEKKLAGILIEVIGDPAGYCQVIVGVGLNVSMLHDSTKDIDQPWVALDSILFEQGLPLIERNLLAALLINDLTNVLQDYQLTGFSLYQTEWMQQAAYLGELVELRNGQQAFSGIFSGVTTAGALRLATTLGERVFHGGEVSLRSAS